MKRLVIARRASQAIFFGIFLYILWSTTYPLEGLLPPETFFRLNPLITLSTSISERSVIPGLFLSGLMLLFTLCMGRFFCGWVCPLGSAIDLAGSIKKAGLSPKGTAGVKFYRIKFFVLSLIFLFSLGGIQGAWLLDPMVIMARFVSMNLIPTVTLAVNSLFVFLIKNFNLYGGFYDVYRALKSSILGIKVSYFSNSGIILLYFLVVVSLSFFVSRFWCRFVCPLGALYGLFARYSIMGRRADGCSDCGLCRKSCRMGAIREENTYKKSECILCMDCIYDCPKDATVFSWPVRPHKAASGTTGTSGITRRNFIILAALSSASLGFKRSLCVTKGSLIRPPGVEDAGAFLNRCIRCGNCMKVCPTNGLQPAALQEGPGGIWTPHLVPEIGYCEYNCTLCGDVCPTGAIPRISVDKKSGACMGTAVIDRSKCIAWADEAQCIVCEEHCPVPHKAIKLKKAIVDGIIVLKPYVDKKSCIGCGICQNKCPVRPVRAIRVKRQVCG